MQMSYDMEISNSGLDSSLSIVKGAVYFFRVACTNKVGSSKMSEVVHANAISVPSFPLGLTSSLTGGGVRLSWLLPLDTGIGSSNYPLQSYIVEMDTNGFSSCTLTGCIAYSVNASQLYFRPQNLQRGTIYYFRVSAVNDAGVSPASSIIAVKAKGTPSEPASFSVLWVDSSSSASLNWLPPLDYGFGVPVGTEILDTYQVECSLDASFNIFLSKVVVTTSTDFSDLIWGKTYFFRVAALNVVGIGPYSNIVRFQVKIRPQVVLVYSPSKSVLPPPDALAPISPSAGGTILLVMVRDTPQMKNYTDRLIVYFGNYSIQISNFSQTPEVCADQTYFRTVFNFTVPSQQYFHQTIPSTVIISFQKIQYTSNSSFKLRFAQNPLPSVITCLPSISSTAGSDLIVLSLQNFGRIASISDIQMYSLSQNFQSALPKLFSYSSMSTTTLISFTTNPSDDGEYSFGLRNRASGQAVGNICVLLVVIPI